MPLRLCAAAHTSQGIAGSLHAFPREFPRRATISDIAKLAVLIRRDRDTLLSRWREQIRALPSAQHLDVPTLNDHVPQLIEELAAAFEARSDETIPEALSETSPPAHGLQRVADGYDIEEVVAEYNILRGCIHDIAHDNGLSLQGKPFHILNRVLDGAIGMAVQTFASQQALEVRHRREEYLSFVAHDLRTPLHAIALATRVLELALPVEGAGAAEAQIAQAQMFKSLRRNVQHLDGLVGKVIEENTGPLAELGIKLERRTFDLWPLVEALVQDLHPVAHTAGTRLSNQVPDDTVVYADASLLRRVFQNVIANAIEYTPGGEIVIGARESDSAGTFECWVRDNGAGIPSERLDKVFDKLEADPGNESALGLGLAIVKTFVEAHHGEVSIESTEGLGSTLRFTLPPRQSAAAAGTAQAGR